MEIFFGELLRESVVSLDKLKQHWKQTPKSSTVNNKYSTLISSHSLPILTVHLLFNFVLLDLFGLSKMNYGLQAIQYMQHIHTKKPHEFKYLVPYITT